MVTHFGGVGDTSMENPDTQDMDNTSEDVFQDENIVQKLLCKTEHLKQVIEDRDNDPREAIHGLEQRLNRLTLTLCCSNDPIENVLDELHQNFMHNTKENIFGEFFITRYPHTEWARLFTA